jgi:hypothetical protein
MQGEDRYHFVTTDNGKETMNMITVGDTTYSKDYADNKWWKKTDNKKQNDVLTSKTTPDYEKNFKDTTVEDKTTYKKITKEACGKLQCLKYQIIDPSNTESAEYIWFDNKEYLLRKTRSEGQDGSVSEQTYVYDKISIKEPSPTKEAKSDMDMFGTGASLPGADMTQLKQQAQDFAKQMQQSAITPPPDTITP